MRIDKDSYGQWNEDGRQIRNQRECCNLGCMRIKSQLWVMGGCIYSILLYGWAAYARTLPTERQCRRGPGERNLLAVPQGSQYRGAYLLIVSFNLRVTWTLWVAGIDPGEKS